MPFTLKLGEEAVERRPGDPPVPAELDRMKNAVSSPAGDGPSTDAQELGDLGNGEQIGVGHAKTSPCESRAAWAQTHKSARTPRMAAT